MEDLDMGSRVMDSNKLERERGITILSKCASIVVPDESEVNTAAGNTTTQINLIDTPGHADFGGEVERIMTMVDGVCLVVDATEGPMSQTKFVLKKALAQGLRPLVVINKCDRDTARIGEVEIEIFDMFDAVGATDEQLDFKVVYTSAKAGWSSTDADMAADAALADDSAAEAKGDMRDLFQMILDNVPAPIVDPQADFSMLVTQMQGNTYVGKQMIGRVKSGKVRVGDSIHVVSPDGNKSEEAKVTKISSWVGIEQIEQDEAQSGDVIAVAGVPDASVNDTIASPSVSDPIPSVPIDPPVLSVVVGSNSASPLNGQDGEHCTFQLIEERIRKECETNVSLKLSDDKISGEQIELSGRGELQIGVLLEQMRREGYEFSVSSPRPVLVEDPETKELLEPVEELIIDVANEQSGTVIEKLAKRKADMVEFEQRDDRSALVFHIPFRALLGYRAEFTQDTRGDGVIHSMFHGYTPYKGEITRSEKGAMVSTAQGKATAHSLGSLEARGTLFVQPGDKVYTDMVIGESSRPSDVECNPCKEKELTNIRSQGKDERVKLTPPRQMTIEECITYVRDDEAIEITPLRISLRKTMDANARRRAAKNKKNAKSGSR